VITALSGIAGLVRRITATLCELVRAAPGAGILQPYDSTPSLSRLIAVRRWTTFIA
jgi:hypothetical protein